jgi:hypothetical protein
MADWVNSGIELVAFIGGTAFATWMARRVRSHDKDLSRLRKHAHSVNGELHNHGLYLEAIARKLGVFVEVPDHTPPEKSL